MIFPAPIAPFKDHIYNDVFQMCSSNPEPPPKFQIHIMNCNLNSHILCLTAILNLIAANFYLYLKTHSLPEFPILVNSNILHPPVQAKYLGSLFLSPGFLPARQSIRIICFFMFKIHPLSDNYSSCSAQT